MFVRLDLQEQHSSRIWNTASTGTTLFPSRVRRPAGSRYESHSRGKEIGESVLAIEQILMVDLGWGFTEHAEL